MTSTARITILCCLTAGSVAACSKAGSSETSNAPNAHMGTMGDFGGGGSATKTSPDAAAPAAEAGADFEDDAAIAQRNRPGLGTEYGESRNSRVIDVPFVRGSNRPDATLAMRYNDFDGVRAMGARSHGANSRVATANGAFVLSVVDANGQLLPSADVGGDRYAIGAAGQRYQVGIENHSGARFEVVGSVDGLDVIDGGEAGFNKRGYILDPFTSVMLEGWRTSHDTVAAFRFGSIADSYAERRGKGRNIGVIGAAFFHEEGANRNELRRRHGADPFPGRFSPAPR